MRSILSLWANSTKPKHVLQLGDSIWDNNNNFEEIALSPHSPIFRFNLSLMTDKLGMRPLKINIRRGGRYKNINYSNRLR